MPGFDDILRNKLAGQPVDLSIQRNDFDRNLQKTKAFKDFTVPASKKQQLSNMKHSSGILYNGSARDKQAFCGVPGMGAVGGGAGAGMGGSLGGASQMGGGGGVGMSDQVPYYDPIFSEDFFEIPYDINIRRIWYMHFYQYDPVVGRSIDLWVNLVASNLKMVLPKCRDVDKAEFVLDFFQRMADRIDLFGKLLEVLFEYMLYGNVFLYAQEGEGVEFRDFKRPDFDSLEEKQQWYDEHVFGQLNPEYLGWEKLLVLPTNQVRVLSKEFTEEVKLQYIPAANVPSVGYGITGSYMTSNLQYSRIKEELPDDLAKDFDDSGVINLETNPYEGSACAHVARRKSGYLDYGISMMDRAIKTLIFRDKLRQIQTITVNRRRVPIRLVWAEEIDELSLAQLEQDVDLALLNPDFSIITNYPVNWEEIGVNDRLLEASAEWEETLKLLTMAFGIPVEMLTGEGTYAGQRINLDVMNAEVSLVRQEFKKRLIEEFIFRPVSYKKGFIEIDDWGGELLIYPRIKFDRPAVADINALIDQMFNLYQRGAISVDPILEVLDIDPEENKKQLRRDFATVNDSRFNDLASMLLTSAGEKLAQSPSIITRIVRALGFDLSEAEITKLMQSPEEMAMGGMPGGDMGLGGGLGGAPDMGMGGGAPDMGMGGGDLGGLPSPGEFGDMVGEGEMPSPDDLGGEVGGGFEEGGAGEAMETPGASKNPRFSATLQNARVKRKKSWKNNAFKSAQRVYPEINPD